MEAVQQQQGVTMRPYKDWGKLVPCRHRLGVSLDRPQIDFGSDLHFR
jgi:hypothetical protein